MERVFNFSMVFKFSIISVPVFFFNKKLKKNGQFSNLNRFVTNTYQKKKISFSYISELSGCASPPDRETMGGNHDFGFFEI